MTPKLKIDFRILKKENWKSILDSEEWKLKKDSKVISQELIIYSPNSQLGGGIFSVPKRKEGFQFVYLNFVVFIMKLPMCDWQ